MNGNCLRTSGKEKNKIPKSNKKRGVYFPEHLPLPLIKGEKIKG
jgi:hypothetical protein